MQSETSKAMNTSASELAPISFWRKPNELGESITWALEKGKDSCFLFREGIFVKELDDLPALKLSVDHSGDKFEYAYHQYFDDDLLEDIFGYNLKGLSEPTRDFFCQQIKVYPELDRAEFIAFLRQDRVMSRPDLTKEGIEQYVHFVSDKLSGFISLEMFWESIVESYFDNFKIVNTPKRALNYTIKKYLSRLSTGTCQWKAHRIFLLGKDSDYSLFREKNFTTMMKGFSVIMLLDSYRLRKVKGFWRTKTIEVPVEEMKAKYEAGEIDLSLASKYENNVREILKFNADKEIIQKQNMLEDVQKHIISQLR